MSKGHPFFAIFFLLFLITACIERYYPEGEEFRSGTLVVIAHLDNSGSTQSICISRSTDLELPTKYPVSGTGHRLHILEKRRVLWCGTKLSGGWNTLLFGL